MLISAIADFFKHKVVSSIIVLTCTWSSLDRQKFARNLSQRGIGVKFSCDPNAVSQTQNHMFQGILYVDKDDGAFNKVKPEYFSAWYKWLILRDRVPNFSKGIRYDADIVLYRRLDPETNNVGFEEIFVHPDEAATSHPWATWNKHGLNITHERNRILRRHNLKKHVLTIAAPTGHYSPSSYAGSLPAYLREQGNPERDSATRAGYGVSSLVIETLNATVRFDPDDAPLRLFFSFDYLVFLRGPYIDKRASLSIISEKLAECPSWSALHSNQSMLKSVAAGATDMAGSILRILPDRIKMLDYIIPIWPFNVGFTYLAERQSSSNMYVEPFSGAVWGACLALVLVLAACQRATARKAEEKEGAYIAVLATWLQQDASAVPDGASGRWSFMVMSMSAMLVHAYYTSAVVSALLRAGTGGPNSLRALADSHYAIASEDFDYMRYLFFDVKTNSTDLEYLKRKKMTSRLYQDVRRGVELIQEGGTAYHTEYNQIYPHFKTFTDDQLCKLQYLDTIPETLTWTTTAKRSQWTDIFRSKGAWLLETGLAHRLVSRLRIKPPPCRAALLAQRVGFGDVTSLIMLTSLGAIMSLIVLGIELFCSKMEVKKVKKGRGRSEASMILNEI